MGKLFSIFLSSVLALAAPLSDLSTAVQAAAEGEALQRQETADSLRKSIEKYRIASDLFRAAGDRKREAEMLHNLGEVYISLGDPAQALENNERALKIRREINDPQGEAESLTKLGVAALAAGDSDQALTSFQKALSIFQRLGSPKGEAASFNGLGQVQALSSRDEEALKTYEQALAAARRAQDQREEASILNHRGMLSYEMGNSEDALRYFEQAISLFRTEGYKRGEATAINNLGLAYDSLGDTKRAAEYYQAALPMFRNLGDRISEAGVLINIGAVFWDQGDFEKALAYQRQSLPVWRSIGQLRHEASVLNNIGAIYETLGDYGLALEHYQQALPLRKQINDWRGEAITLSNMGNLYLEAKDFQKALEAQTTALAILRELGDRRYEAGVLHNLGKLYSVWGDKKKALDHYGQAITIRREIRELVGLSATLGNMGTTYRSLGEWDKAKEAYAESLSLARAIGDRSGEALTHLSVSRLLRLSGDLPGALSQAQEALSIMESRRSLTNSDNIRSSLFVAMQQYYEQYITVLFDLRMAEPPHRSSDSQSFVVSERAKARSLLDTLLEGAAEIRRGAPPDLLESERGLQKQINNKELEGRRLAGQEAEKGRKEIDQLLSALDSTRAEIRARSPRYAALTQPDPLPVEKIQALLGSGTLLLSYFLGEERSFVWAVTRSSLTAYELPARAEIESAARELHAFLSKSDQRLARRPTEQAASRLAGMILRPIEELVGKERLVIVADGALHYIPFGVLPAPGEPGKPLIFAHEIVNLPSASVLALLRQEAAGHSKAIRQVAVLADPVFAAEDPRVSLQATPGLHQPAAEPSVLQRAAKNVGLDGFSRLRFTRDEAESIASLLPPGEVLKALDFEASKEMVTGGTLAGSRILHFATHGLLDTRRPELSGLVLSLVDRKGNPRDGFLRFHEIYNLDLPNDLVVLSACETALGKEVRGEGLMALTRGFMYAGTQAVVASLWRIDDRSTAELMKRFYRGLLTKGLSPPAALRAAQLSLWKDRSTESPYFWAGFVYQGDWQKN